MGRGAGVGQAEELRRVGDGAKAHFPDKGRTLTRDEWQRLAAGLRWAGYIIQGNSVSASLRACIGVLLLHYFTYCQCITLSVIICACTEA